MTMMDPPASALLPEGGELSAQVRHHILLEWNDTGAPLSPRDSLKDLFERRVVLAPHDVALVFQEQELAYYELDRRANRLAQGLIRLGVGPEALVALHFTRGLEMVVAMLGVHKAGGAYLPLDPAFPPDRLQFMVHDAGVRIVLSDQPGELSLRVRMRSIDEVSAGHQSSNPQIRVDLDNLAYVIYTSGSTGRPKGVQVTQGALSNFLLSMKDRPGVSDSDVLVAVTTLSFDIAGLEIFLPLIAGGRVVIAPRETAMDGTLLANLLGQSAATLLQATPITWKLLLQASWKGSRRLRMLCGGEALPWELARALLGTGGTLWNLYGPTETTIWSAISQVEESEGPVLIGRPIAATELFILDAAMQPVPVGVTGDLYIGGAGLARGYLGQPSLTAERFSPCPFGDRPGARHYCTGDRARWATDGQVEFVGRADHQVKIRGFRIEVGEIESVLLESPGVQDAVVVAVPSKSGERRLVAYIVPRGEPALVLQELQEILASRLPDYMRPAAFVPLSSLPLTPNNKVDRRALPEIGADEPTGSPAARTPLEELIFGIWSDVLELRSIGAQDNFFALGGHSLLVGQVIARLRDALGVELFPRILFEHSTLEAFTLAVEDRLRSQARGLPSLARAPREGLLPLSFAQEQLWLYDQLNPHSNAFNLGYTFRLRGNLDFTLLDLSLERILQRHEVLRTRIVAGAGAVPLQSIGSPPRRPLTRVDLSQLPTARREQAADEAVDQLLSAPFDLASGPLLRLVVLDLEPKLHLFSLIIHHIACDGWSLKVLIREVTLLYRAFSTSSVPLLPELPVQYADFAVWQRGWLQDEILEDQLGYWARCLADHPPALLPTDRPRYRAGGSLRVSRRTIQPELLAGLARLGREQGATLFMTLLAALNLLLYRYTGSERIVVGSMHANRSHSAVEDLIGFFANVLPLATTLAPDWSFLDLLSCVRDSALGAYAHQDTPYEKVLERVRPRRSGGRNALFQVMVIFQNFSVPPLQLFDLDVEPWDSQRAGKRAAYDLTLSFTVDGDRLHCWAEYDSGLFEEKTAGRLLAHFEKVLGDVMKDPGQRIDGLPCLEGEDVRQSLKIDGTLWLTNAAQEEGAPEGPSAQVAEEKAAAIQDQLAARRSRLSEKKQELLRQRLKG